uniref:Uncharacterized protein n=1 Tax=Tetranychus urticae TaxID=32264 RepID=T1JZM4_TETUR
MDLSDLLGYSPQCATPTIFGANFEFSESTQGHQSSITSSDHIKMNVFQALSPSEDTIKSYLINEDDSSSLPKQSCMSDDGCSTLLNSMSNGFYAEGTVYQLWLITTVTIKHINVK